jgi:hypothetical protein
VERRIPPSLFPDLQRWRRKGGLSFSKGPIRVGDDRFCLEALEHRVRELPAQFRDLDARLAEIVLSIPEH